MKGTRVEKYDNVVVSSSGHFGTNNTSFELLLYCKYKPHRNTCKGKESLNVFELQRYETLICLGEPLPLQGYDGHWSSLVFGSFNESSVISKNSFPGNTFENVQISGSLTLESIESGFLQRSENVLKQLTIIGNYELRCQIPF